MGRHFKTLLDLACGRAISDEDGGQARRLQLIIAGLLGSLVFAALWGLAAGSQAPGLAAANLYKVPMVVLLSALAATPAGLLAWKLSGAQCRGSDLVISFVAAIFSGTLVMAVVSPLVALYYHSSTWAGPVLGMGSTFLALLVGTVIFIRGVFLRRPAATPRGALVLPVAVFVVMQAATLVQLVALAAPILPELTVFDGGIDRMVHR